MAIDPAFGVDSFGNPKMYSESETLARNILTILFGKELAYPTMPSFGMDIPKLILTMYDEISEDDLKNELIGHCTHFREVVQTGEFDVIKTILKDSLGNDAPSILFQIPTQIKHVSRTLVIGITATQKHITYNFVWLDE